MENTPEIFYQTVEDQHQDWITANPEDPNYLTTVKPAFHIGIYQYKGGKSRGNLVFDIDNTNPDSEKTPNIEQSITDGINLLDTLKAMGVDENQLELYASGGKGFHVIVPGRLFGAHRFIENLHKYHKYMAEEISKLAKLKGWDASLYCGGKGKLLRVENKPRANGHFKVPITPNELRAATPDWYGEITATPRSRTWEIVDPTIAEDLTSLYREGLVALEAKNAATVNPIPPDLLEKLGEGYDLPCKLVIVAGVDNSKDKTASNNRKAQSMALLLDRGLATDDDVINYATNNANAKHNKENLINHVKAARSDTPKDLSCGLMMSYTGVTKAACKHCKINPVTIEKVKVAEANLADKKVKLEKAAEFKQAKLAEAVAIATAELEKASAIQEAIELEDEAKLAEFVLERNKENAKVFFAGKVVSMNARFVTELVGDNYETHFKHDFENINELIKFSSHEPKFMVGDKPVNRIAAWANHKNVRAYREVKFEPYNTYEARSKYTPREGCYNLWQGYAAAPQDHQINYPYLMRLIYEICEGRAEWVTYLFDWIAIGFQKPQAKVGVALCIRGGEGSGKGSLLHFLRKLWGSHGGYVSNGKQVTGNFNAHLQALCYLFADEALFAGDKAVANAFKSLITEDVIAIERKGFDVTQERNYLRIAMASNHDWMIDASKDARRFCVFDLNKIPDDESFFYADYSYTDWSKFEGFEEEGFTRDDYLKLHTHRFQIGEPAKGVLDNENLPIIQAKQFYKELHAELSQIEVKEQFLFDMLNRDVTEFVPNKNIPQTKALREQKLHTLSGDSVAMWLLELLHEDEGVIAEFDKDGNFKTSHSLYTEGVPNKLLYDNYNAYCKKVDVRGFKLLNPIHFSRDLTAKGVKSSRSSTEKRKYVDRDFFNTLRKNLGV